MNKKKALTTIGLASSTLYLYSNFVKNRSVSSLAIENIFRLQKFINKHKSVDEQLAELFRQSITESAHPLALPKPFVSSSVYDFYHEDMQVFCWNDQNDKHQKIIYYIHGGGYVCGPLLFHFRMVDAIAKKTNAKVIFPIYPRLPNATFKDAYPKIISLYQMVLNEIGSPDQLTLMGDSAGGGFALGLSLWLKDNNLPQPKDIILLSPWMDLATNNPAMAPIVKEDAMLSADQLSILGNLWADGELQNPYASPLFGDPSNLGRLSLFTGTREIFYPDIKKYHDILNQKQINHTFYIAPQMNHVFVAYPIPEANVAQQKISEIIQTP